MSNKKAKITDLKFDEQNINKGSEYGNFLLEQSLREGGAGRSILIDKNNVIIAGNQTAAKAGEIGLEDVIIVPTDGKKIIAVQRTDIDINSAVGAKLKILDNTVSKHNYVENIEVAAIITEAYDLEPAKLGLSGEGAQDQAFKPTLEPTYNHQQVTDEDIAKTSDELLNKMKQESELREVVCPHCNETFYIK